MPGSGSERATARALVPVSRTIVDPNSTEGGADGPDVSQWGRDARRARALHDRGRAAGGGARYRFFSVRDEFPALCPAAEGGQPVLGELYDMPMGPLSALLATEPPELELSVIELDDGELSFAMVLREAEHALGLHKDITSHGGWRAYRASLAQP